MKGQRTRRGAATENLKLGLGGLSDIEWTVQLLQLQHAGQMPKLRVPGTQDALEVARKTMLISDTDAEALSVAWQLASQLRNKAMLVRGRPSDAVALRSAGDSLGGDPARLRARPGVTAHGCLGEGCQARISGSGAPFLGPESMRILLLGGASELGLESSAN